MRSWLQRIRALRGGISMDAIYLGLSALIALLTIGMAWGCARLGGGRS